MSSLTRLIFPRRLRRIGFIVRFIVFAILTEFCYQSVRFSPPPLALAWSLATGVIVAYSLVFVFLPRLFDAGMSGWWLVVTLFPLFVWPFALVLACEASNARSNTPDGFFWT